jgi:hypothetical protein
MTTLDDTYTLGSVTVTDAPDRLVPAIEPAPLSRRRQTLRVLALVVLAAAVVVGVLAWRKDGQAPRVQAAPGAVMPASAIIEQTWGIRFVAVSVLADGGLVEVRYQVVDPGKSTRIHAGDATSSKKYLPILVVEGTGAKVETRSVMFQFNHPTDKSGRLYSIIYGNASGALKPHTLVTIHMSDGTELQHVPVTI